MAFQTEEEKIDQEDMVEVEMAVCRQVECGGERRKRVRNNFKFMSLGDWEDRGNINSSRKFANTCLLLGEEDELRFSHVQF